VASRLSLVLLVAAVYAALRPPLYDFDGVMYRMHAAEPPALQINAHHVAWYAVQHGLAAMAPERPELFQYFGIAVTAAALLAFHALLARAARPDFALVATLLVGFSPQVWWLGLQNQPYPLVFLFVVLYLHAWMGKTAPSGWRLAGAGATLAAAVLFHQGAAVLAAGGMLALTIVGEAPRRARTLTALAWGAATGAAVLAAYLWIGRVVDWRGVNGFLRWVTGYLRTQHPIQVEMPDYLAKSVIGICRALLESDGLENQLAARFSYGQVLWVYGGAGMLAATVLGFACRRIPVRALVRSNPLFAAALASLLSWSAFVFAWEPLGYYWSLALFLALACAGAAARRDARAWGAPMKIALAATAALSAWNVYASNARDRAGGINAPESLVPSIEEQLGPRDVFLVLRQDWSGGMDYDLLFETLKRRPRNPAIFLIEDFVLQRNPTPWQDRMSRRLESVWAAGGRVFAAEALFEDDAYADLARARNPFSTFVEETYRGIDGPALEREVQALVDRYTLVSSTFHVGLNAFVEVRLSN
jgi:hypothetical protein